MSNEDPLSSDYKNSIGNKLQDFKILKELGKGSYGTVYTVQSNIDEMIYVMKKLELKNLKEKQQKECWKEVSILKKVNHPNIIKYYSSFLDSDNWYIIMEYAEWGDWYALIKHYKRHSKLIEEFDLWRISYDILKGWEYLHKNKIIHRDIKLLNWFITKDKRIKIGDWGVSTIVSNINAMHNTRVGTPWYLSPELIKQIPYDFKVDIWSFGCSVYHWACWEPPFSGDNLIVLGNNIVKGKQKHIPSQYTESLITFIDKALSKRPESRFTAVEGFDLIPKDIMERIKNAKDNNMEIKARPFSSLGNRVITYNKEEIKSFINNNDNKKEKAESEAEVLNKDKEIVNESDKKNWNKGELKSIIEENPLNSKGVKAEAVGIQQWIDVKNNPNASHINKADFKGNKLTNYFRETEWKSDLEYKNPRSQVNKINKIFTNSHSNKQTNGDVKNTPNIIENIPNTISIPINGFRKKINSRLDNTVIPKPGNNDINLINVINKDSSQNSIRWFHEHSNKEGMKGNDWTSNINNIEHDTHLLNHREEISHNNINNKKVFNTSNKAKSKTQQNVYPGIIIKGDQTEQKTDFRFPDVNQRHTKSNNQDININKGYIRIASTKGRGISQNTKMRPWTANTFGGGNRSNLQTHMKSKTSRPMTAFNLHHKDSTQGNSNSGNIINININFYNVDMNKRFLAPNINPLKNANSKQENEDTLLKTLQMPNLNNYKKVNLQNYANGNQHNNFIFDKIIKTWEQTNNARRLTINDLE